MVTLSFGTTGAAFDTAPENEVARILQEVARRVGEQGCIEGAVFDVNGNKIGSFDWDCSHVG